MNLRAPQGAANLTEGVLQADRYAEFDHRFFEVRIWPAAAASLRAPKGWLVGRWPGVWPTCVEAGHLGSGPAAGAADPLDGGVGAAGTCPEVHVRLPGRCGTGGGLAVLIGRVG